MNQRMDSPMKISIFDYTDVFNEVVKLKAERDTLKEQKDASYNALKQVIVNQGEELESFYELFDNQSMWYDYIYDKLQNCKSEGETLRMDCFNSEQRFLKAELKATDNYKEWKAEQKLRVEAEAEVKKWKGDWNRVATERNDALDRLAKAQELIAREWDSPTCIQDSEKIEEYEHCTCAEDYANAFVKRLKKSLGGES